MGCGPLADLSLWRAVAQHQGVPLPGRFEAAERVANAASRLPGAVAAAASPGVTLKPVAGAVAPEAASGAGSQAPSARGSARAGGKGSAKGKAKGNGKEEEDAAAVP